MASQMLPGEALGLLDWLVDTLGSNGTGSSAGLPLVASPKTVVSLRLLSCLPPAVPTASMPLSPLTELDAKLLGRSSLSPWPTADGTRGYRRNSVPALELVEFGSMGFATTVRSANIYLVES